MLYTTVAKSVWHERNATYPIVRQKMKRFILGGLIGAVLGASCVLVAERRTTRTTRHGVVEERTPVKAAWIVFQEPGKVGRPTMLLEVGGSLVVGEFDSNGDEKVDKISLSLEGVPFLMIRDSKFTGTFDKVECYGDGRSDSTK
jgi:hypothetical protein